MYFPTLIGDPRPTPEKTSLLALLPALWEILPTMPHWVYKHNSHVIQAIKRTVKSVR